MALDNDQLKICSIRVPLYQLESFQRFIEYLKFRLFYTSDTGCSHDLFYNK